MILRCERPFDKGNCVRTNFCGGRQEGFSLIRLAGYLCYTLVMIAFGAPDDSAAFQDRGFRAFGIAATYKVVVNIEREFDRGHKQEMMNPSSNRLCVLLLGTFRLLVLRTVDRRGRPRRVGEPAIEQN